MKKIILIALLIFPIIISAQEAGKSYSFSIKQAQQYAIDNNKTLKNSKIDVDIAKKQLWQVIAKGLPQVSGTIDYTTYFNYSMSLGLGGGSSFSPTPEQMAVLDAGDLALLQLLGSTMGGGTEIKMKDAANAKIQVSQLLFSGEYILGIQMSKIAQMLVDINNEKSVLDIKESVTNTYYSSLIIQKSIEILDANIENLDQTLTKTQALFNTGMIEETGVDQLKMTISGLRSSKSALLRNAELNLNLLKLQLSLNPDDVITLTENFDDVFGSIDFSKVLDNTFDINDNVNMRLLEKQENLFERQVALKRWAYSPTLAGAYNHTEKLMKTDFDMNPKNLFALQLSIPIWSSGDRKAAVDEQRLELLKVRNNREIVSDQLLLQEKQLKFNLASALEQYSIQKENVALATKIYNNTELKFRQGVASSFDLIQANTSLLQAQSSFITSGMELLQAKLAFDKLINNI
ncbi:MAG: TolC family protein [Bacteroidales bacterium]|jgi:outer membrane protein TolC|nr:TolC family protein [Bacteroidales bacterium]